MPLDPLYRHYAMTTPASVYDEESLTALELAGRTANKVNECVQAFNDHEKSVNNDVENFKETVSAEMEEFQNNVNETTEDFKDNVDQKIADINGVIVNKLGVRTVYDYHNGVGNRPETPPVYVDGGLIYVEPGVYFTASGSYTLPFNTNMLIPTAEAAQTLYVILRPEDDHGAIVQLRNEDGLEANDFVICSAYVTSNGKTTLSNDSLFSRYYTRSVEKQLPLYRKITDDAITGYVISGGFAINTTEKTIAVTRTMRIYCPTGTGSKIVAINTGSPRPYNIPSGNVGTLRITMTAAGNYLEFGTFETTGEQTIYLGVYDSGVLYGNNFNPDVTVTIDGVDHLAGEISDRAAFVPEAVTNAINIAVEKGANLSICCPAKIDWLSNNDKTVIVQNLSIDPNVEAASNSEGFYTNPANGANSFCINDVDPGMEFTGILALYKNGIEQDKKTVTVGFYNPDNAPGEQITVLLIGDSMIDNNYVPTTINEKFQGFDIDPNFIGTQVTSGVKHEAHSGWSFDKFVNFDSVDGVSNPFVSDGEFSGASVREYLSGLGASKVDYIFICLGANDIKMGRIFDTTNISDVVNNAKTFVQALLDGVYMHTGKYPFIGVTLIPTGNSTQYLPDIAPGAMHRRITQLNLALIENFDNGVFNTNVTTVPVNLFHNKTDHFMDAINPSALGAEIYGECYVAKVLANGG